MECNWCINDAGIKKIAYNYDLVSIEWISTVPTCNACHSTGHNQAIRFVFKSIICEKLKGTLEYY